MSSSPSPAPASPPPQPTEAPKHQNTETPVPSRLQNIVRWATRLTSLPVLGLALVSLLPALLSFSVSAHDDKLIALGLGAVCLGFVLAWRWPAAGGATSLAGIALISLHDDTSLAGDPFLLAFTLQATLFLISSVLGMGTSPRPGKPAAPALRLVRATALGLLAVGAFAGALALFHGPASTPLAADKAGYLGRWDSGTGLKLEISKNGLVRVTELADARVSPCNTPVKPGETRTFNASFRGDDHLELASGSLGEPKLYLIERHPHMEGKRMTMTLNASDPYQRTNRLFLTRTDSPK